MHVELWVGMQRIGTSPPQPLIHAVFVSPGPKEKCWGLEGGVVEKVGEKEEWERKSGNSHIRVTCSSSMNGRNKCQQTTERTPHPLPPTPSSSSGLRWVSAVPCTKHHQQHRQLWGARSLGEGRWLQACRRPSRCSGAAQSAGRAFLPLLPWERSSAPCVCGNGSAGFCLRVRWKSIQERQGEKALKRNRRAKEELDLLKGTSWAAQEGCSDLHQKNY